MSKIVPLNTDSYQLAEEVFFGLYAEQQTSLALLKGPTSCSISVHGLNFAMINGLTELALIMIQLFQKNVKALNEGRTLYYQLRPLHVATIIQRMDFVSALVNAGVDINARDHRDWTALHHAALTGDEKNIQFLTANGADKDAETDSEGTYQDILRLTTPPQNSETTEIPIVLQTTGGKLEKLTHQKFKELTGACYLEENYVERSWLIRQWKESTYTRFSEMDPFFSQAKEKYKREFHIPSIFEMQRITCDDSQRKLDSSPGFGLLATKSHKKGDVLGEYKAYIGPKDIYDDYAMMSYWQARHYRNAMAMINDGYPNALGIGVQNVHGLPSRMLIIAISPIEKGEQICFNYGAIHGVKQLPYTELRGQALRKMLNSFDLTIKKKINDPFTKMQLEYVSDTPIVLFNMIWDGSITFEIAENFIKHLYENDTDGLKDRMRIIKSASIAHAIKNMYLVNETDKSKFSEAINHLKKKVDASQFCKLLYQHLGSIAKAARTESKLVLPKAFTEPDDEKKSNIR